MITFRRSFPLTRHTRASLSRRGVSLSRRLGPVSVSSSGRGSVRLGRGLGWRWGR